MLIFWIPAIVYLHRDDNIFLFCLRFCYLKATKGLESQLKDLEVMRTQLAVTQAEVEGWVTDVKEWAECESYTITDQLVSSAD